MGSENLLFQRGWEKADPSLTLGMTNNGCVGFLLRRRYPVNAEVIREDQSWLLLRQHISCKLHVMIDLANIHSLSEFNRNSKDFIRKLKKSGKPAVLTVNGQAEVVVQSAEAYQRLLEDRQLLEIIRGISRGLDQARRGEGRPMRDLIEELASEHGISLK